jgi:membrane associated rhomboid family serine protease
MYQANTNIFDDLRKFFRMGSALANLIIINVAVWLLVQSMRIFFFLYNQPDAALATSSIIRIFGVPASLSSLEDKPWTLFTYMFLHVDIWHILFNMLWLYWFGKIFLEYLGGRRLLIVYLLGGVSGGLVYIAAFNIFPVFSASLPQSYALGASASVMAIVTAISFKVPNYSIFLLFFGRIRIVYLAIALFIFDFFMIPSGNAGGHIAHIGGALFGFLYVQIIGISSISGYSKKWNWNNVFRKKQKQTNPYEMKNRPLSDDEYNRKKVEKQKRIDDILEKISKGGYDSLTREEKELLFKSSGQDR